MERMAGGVARKVARRERRVVYDHLLRVRPDGYLLRLRAREARRLQRLERVAQKLSREERIRPVARGFDFSAGYTPTRACAPSFTTAEVVGNVLGTLIKDLEDAGILLRTPPPS
ncbi:MAG: hypothetical protein QN137_14365 [Armatimonadota bacterium]|nr:hypothetical protein [Armatimonadota bacterium]